MRFFRSSKKYGLPSERRNPALIWNVLTILVVVSLLCVVSAIVLIFNNPYSSVNPFPPPTLPPTITPTITPRVTMVPTWTATPPIKEATSTPLATQTPELLDTSTVAPTATEINLTSQPEVFSFVLRAGSPLAVYAPEFHPGSGCRWSGVAGQAISENDEPVEGIFVQAGGSLPDGEPIDKLVMTGSAEQYGPGGFEITLADHLFASNDSLWIQLLDQQSLPLSDKIYFDTFNDCDKGLILIFFEQAK